MSKLNKLCEKIKKIDWRGNLGALLGFAMTLIVLGTGAVVVLGVVQLLANIITFLFKIQV